VGERAQDHDVVLAEGVFLPAFDIQNPQQSFGVVDRNAEDRTRIRQKAEQTLLAFPLHKREFIAASDAAKDADSEWDAAAESLRARTGFGFDLDLFRGVVEHAEADVIELKVLLDLAD